MNGFQIIGWKTYAVAALAILFGVFRFYQGNVSDSAKYIIGGFTLIALRDVLGKILRCIDDNRKAMNNMRSAIEVLLDQSRRK